MGAALTNGQQFLGQRFIKAFFLVLSSFYWLISSSKIYNDFLVRCRCFYIVLLTIAIALDTWSNSNGDLVMAEALWEVELKRRKIKGLIAELDTIVIPIIAWQHIIMNFLNFRLCLSREDMIMKMGGLPILPLRFTLRDLLTGWPLAVFLLLWLNCQEQLTTIKSSCSVRFKI